MRAVWDVARSVQGRVGFVVGVILNILGVWAFVADSGFSAAVWFAIGGWVLFLATFWELLARVKQSANDDTAARTPGSSNWLLLHAASIEEMMVGERTVVDGVVRRSPVRWPDGTRGEFVADRINMIGAIDSYHVTYEGKGGRRTVRQPLVSRDASGHVVHRPEPIVESSL